MDAVEVFLGKGYVSRRGCRCPSSTQTVQTPQQDDEREGIKKEKRRGCVRNPKYAETLYGNRMNTEYFKIRVITKGKKAIS